MSGDVIHAPAIEGRQARIDQLEAERASTSETMLTEALVAIAGAAETLGHLGGHGALTPGLRDRLRRFGGHLANEVRSITAQRARVNGL